MTSLEALLKEGTKVLEEKKIQEARLDAWLLLEYVTGVSRALYFADPKKAVEEEKAEEYTKHSAEITVLPTTCGGKIYPLIDETAN